MTPPLQLSEEQKKTYLEAKAKRFLEKYEQLVGETGMTLMPIIQFNPSRGLFPDMAVVPKNLDKKEEVQENKENVPTGNDEKVKED